MKHLQYISNHFGYYVGEMAEGDLNAFTCSFSYQEEEGDRYDFHWQLKWKDEKSYWKPYPWYQVNGRYHHQSFEKILGRQVIFEMNTHLMNYEEEVLLYKKKPFDIEEIETIEYGNLEKLYFGYRLQCHMKLKGVPYIIPFKLLKHEEPVWFVLPFDEETDFPMGYFLLSSNKNWLEGLPKYMLNEPKLRLQFLMC